MKELITLLKNLLFGSLLFFIYIKIDSIYEITLMTETSDGVFIGYLIIYIIAKTAHDFIKL
jgi:hypothetical protein